MKFAMIAAFVVLALAQGSVAPEAPSGLDTVTQFLEDMRTKLLSTAQELKESINVDEVASQAQTFLENSNTQLAPLANIPDQLTTFASSVEDQVTPLATSMQAQLADMLQNLMAQAQAIGQ